MKQIIIIHGWECFNKEELYTYLQTTSHNPYELKERRRDRLQSQCKDSHAVIIPSMPNKYSADYTAWKIRFERHFPYLNNENTILVWHSLGASFLLKRLSENKFPKQVSQLHLVCSCVESKWLIWEGIGNFWSDRKKIATIQKQVDQICIYHSKDDEVVPYRHSEKLSEFLPQAKFFSFENRGHFNQPALPELLENINYYEK